MESTKGTWVHPEARLEVIKEFKRLKDKHPNMNGNELWEMARDYAWTVALADSAIIRCEMLI